jgi:NitT/TauT family transport system substrate-binding protein
MNALPHAAPAWLGRRQVLASALALPSLPAWAAPKPLLVGGLPVTCNLTLPVACVAKQAANAADKSGGPRYEFEYSKYNGWPEIKESLMTGSIQAAYMLAPLVMDLADKKIPVKIVSLGHRSGAVIMVRSDSPHQKFKDLTGKRIAIPSRFAVDFLFLRKMLAREGMTPKDIQIVEMRRPTCRLRSTPRRSTPTAPASPSAPRPSAPATPARCA